MKCQGGLEKCFNTSPEKPTGRGWVLALPVSPSAKKILTSPSLYLCNLLEKETQTELDGDQAKENSAKARESTKLISYLLHADILVQCYSQGDRNSRRMFCHQ